MHTRDPFSSSHPRSLGDPPDTCTSQKLSPEVSLLQTDTYGVQGSPNILFSNATTKMELANTTAGLYCFRQWKSQRTDAVCSALCSRQSEKAPSYTYLSQETGAITYNILASSATTTVSSPSRRVWPTWPINTLCRNTMQGDEYSPQTEGMTLLGGIITNSGCKPTLSSTQT